MRASELQPGQVALATCEGYECVLIRAKCRARWESLDLDDGAAEEAHSYPSANDTWTDVRPLTVARPITADDLPDLDDVFHFPSVHDDVFHFPSVHVENRRGAQQYRDAVVEHLNARGGVAFGDALQVDAAERERDEAVKRAEKAEAELVEMRSDPIIYAVRESDLPEVRLVDGEWWGGGVRFGRIGITTAENQRRHISQAMKRIAAREAVARAIEAHEAEAAEPDPVEQKAREYLTVMFDYEDIDSASPADWAAATRMARHVLAKEAER